MSALGRALCRSRLTREGERALEIRKLSLQKKRKEKRIVGTARQVGAAPYAKAGVGCRASLQSKTSTFAGQPWAGIGQLAIPCKYSLRDARHAWVPRHHAIAHW